MSLPLCPASGSGRFVSFSDSLSFLERGRGKIEAGETGKGQSKDHSM